MPIKFSCPRCCKPYSLRPELAGKSAQCGCGHTMTVPAQSAENSGEEILDISAMTEETVGSGDEGAELQLAPAEGSFIASNMGRQRPATGPRPVQQVAAAPVAPVPASSGEGNRLVLPLVAGFLAILATCVLVIGYQQMVLKKEKPDRVASTDDTDRDSKDTDRDGEDTDRDSEIAEAESEDIDLGNGEEELGSQNMDLDLEDPGPEAEEPRRTSSGTKPRRRPTPPVTRKEKRVEIGAGDVTIRDDRTGLSHVKIECNSGLVIDADWKRNRFNDFGYDIYEPSVNMDANRLTVMTLARTVIANYLNGKYD